MNKGEITIDILTAHILELDYYYDDKKVSNFLSIHKESAHNFTNEELQRSISIFSSIFKKMKLRKCALIFNPNENIKKLELIFNVFFEADTIDIRFFHPNEEQEAYKFLGIDKQQFKI